MTRASSYKHISDKHSHWTYVTHETRGARQACQEGQEKRPRPSAWLGQGQRPRTPRQRSFHGTTAIVVRSAFDRASVADAHRAHIDHDTRADSDVAQRSAKRYHSPSPGRARRSSRSSSRALPTRRSPRTLAPSAGRLREPARSGRRAWRRSNGDQGRSLKALERKTGRLRDCGAGATRGRR